MEYELNWLKAGFTIIVRFFMKLAGERPIRNPSLGLLSESYFLFIFIETGPQLRSFI